VDWLTAGVECVKALAWPIAVVVLACFFGTEIKRLVPRLRRFKHGESEVEFSEILKQVGEIVPKPKLEQARLIIGEASQSRKLSLGFSSPRDSIIYGWAHVEAAVLDAAKRKGQNLSKVPPAARFWAAWTFLANNAPIPDYMASAMALLVMIRNRVVHDPDFEPPAGDVRQFTMYCRAIMDDLERLV